MHVSDGILPAEVVAGAGVAAAAFAGALLSRTDGEKVPRVALCTSFFFVASLVHVRLGPTSFHLVLIGLIGIIMGAWAFLPILFGLILQAVLFQHGGLTTVGVNAMIMGLPAYAAYGVFRLGRRMRFRGSTPVFGFLAGFLALELGLLLLKAFLVFADSSFVGLAWAAVALHQPLALLEGAVTASAAALLEKAEPLLLEPHHA